MISNKYQRILLVTALSVFLLMSISSAGSTSGKIPITTKSKTALNHYLTGRDLSERLRGNEALVYFEKAVKADPDFAMAYVGLALVQTSFQGFFDTFEKAEALIDKVSEGERYLILGLQAGTNNDPMKQRKYYKKLTAAYPNDERAYTLLGNHYFGQQEYELAIDEYNKAKKNDAVFSAPYNQLGYSYKFIGEFEKAKKAFEKYIALIPNDPNPYDSYAELLLKMGKYEESIASYKKALAINPAFMVSHVGIASNYNFMGEHEKARAQLKRMLNAAEDNGQRRFAYSAMAVSYADEGNLERAYEYVEKQYSIAQAINDQPALANDLIVMGQILMEMGKYNTALEKFEHSLAIMQNSDLSMEIKNFNERENYYYQGCIALMTGDKLTASEKSKLYLSESMANKNPFQIKRAHQLAGMIALDDNDYHRAIGELEKSNLQNPYNLFRLAHAYEGIGKMDKAKKLFMKSARYNALNNLNLAFIRNKAEHTVAGF